MARSDDNPDFQRDEPTAVRVPSGAPSWITPELIAHTLRVWQPYYQKPLTPEEALEMILGVSRLSDVLASDQEQRASQSPDSDAAD